MLGGGGFSLSLLLRDKVSCSFIGSTLHVIWDDNRLGVAIFVQMFWQIVALIQTQSLSEFLIHFIFFSYVDTRIMFFFPSKITLIKLQKYSIKNPYCKC